MMLISGIASIFVTNPVSRFAEQLTSLPFFVGLLIIAVTPAICEEWIFRGYIQSHYSELPIRTTAIINGLFFGIIHLTLHQFPYAFLMGVIFAYMVYYTRSVYAGIWAHFAVNAMQFFLLYTASLLPEAPPPAADIDIRTTLMQLLTTAIIFLPGAIILLSVFVSHNRHRNIKWDLQAVLASSRIRTPNANNIDSPFNMTFFVIIIMYAAWMWLLL